MRKNTRVEKNTKNPSDNFFHHTIVKWIIPLGLGVCSLLALEPFGFWILGFVYIYILYKLDKMIGEDINREVIFIGIFSSPAIGVFVFHWMWGAIRNLTEASIYAVTAMFFLFLLGSQLKIFTFFLLRRFISRYIPIYFNKLIYLNNKNNHTERIKIPSPLPYPLSFLAGLFIADLFTPQIFPLYLGDLFRTNSIFSNLSAWGGLSLVFVMGAIPVLFFEWSKRSRWLLGIIWILLLILSWVRYSIPNPHEDNPIGMEVVSFQPNLDFVRQEERETNEYVEMSLKILQSQIEEAVRFRKENGMGKWDLGILPESSIPFFSSKESSDNISKGAFSSSFRDLVKFSSEGLDSDWVYNEIDWTDNKLYNLFSLYSPMDELFTNEEEMEAKKSHRKVILFPFGEYVPVWIRYLGLGSFFRESSLYEEGTVSEPIYWKRKGIYILPTICYEAMYPNHIRSFYNSNKDISLIVNLTNDSWFSSSIQAHQHMGSVRMRAIENNLPMIRSALNGISTAWDERGRDLWEPIAYGERGLGMARLRVFSSPQRTFYNKWGDMPLGLIFFLFFVFQIIKNRN